MATTLGVPVAIIANSGQSGKLLRDPLWSSNGLLQSVPAETEALREFLVF
jgi:hypothetical protein